MYTYISMCACVYTHMYMYVCTYMTGQGRSGAAATPKYIYIDLYMCIYIHVYMYVCASVRAAL